MERNDLLHPFSRSELKLWFRFISSALERPWSSINAKPTAFEGKGKREGRGGDRYETRECYIGFLLLLVFKSLPGLSLKNQGEKIIP